MQIRKILLAEDDHDDQHLFMEFLRERRDIVIMPLVENGEDLLTFLDKRPRADQLPDLILLDQNMPKLNGVQTLQLLKNSLRYQHIPVAIYSTYADEALVTQSRLAGACEVLTKPLNKEGYHELIDSLLECC